MTALYPLNIYDIFLLWNVVKSCGNRVRAFVNLVIKYLELKKKSLNHSGFSSLKHLTLVK